MLNPINFQTYQRDWIFFRQIRVSKKHYNAVSWY